MNIKQLVEKLNAKKMTMQLITGKDAINIMISKQEENGITRNHPSRYQMVDILNDRIDIDEMIQEAISLF